MKVYIVTRRNPELMQIEGVYSDLSMAENEVRALAEDYVERYGGHANHEVCSSYHSETQSVWEIHAEYLK